MIVAVDGPAASGKGSIARAIAARFGLPHMDTGLLYRATALNLLETGGDPESEFAAARGTSRLRGLGALRHKESDRIAATAAGLAAFGV